MTTIAIPGLKLTYHFDDVISVSATEARITVPSASSTFSYALDSSDPFPYVEVDTDASQAILDNQLLRALEATTMVDAALGTVTWSGGSATVLEISWETGPETNTNLYFVLDGTALPDISTSVEWDAFDDSLISVAPATGAFGPGRDILWTEFNDSTVTEDDEFYGTAANETFEGGLGDDYFNSSPGDDTYKGGAGTFDQVNFAFDPAGVTANLRTRSATDGWGDSDTLLSIESLRGSGFDDVLIGNGGRNYIRGLAGDDELVGLRGRDEVRYDRDYRFGGTDGVTVNLKRGTATDGFGDSDTLRGFEDVRGTESRDKIIGSGARNELEGLGGNDLLKGLANRDVLLGNAGRDKLLGGGGNDTLEGGSHRDRLIGGGGDDDLYGGGGFDRFIFRGKFGDDTIHDFRKAGKAEKIDLSGVKPIKGFRDLKNNHLGEVDGDAVIDDGNGNTITLDGIGMDELKFNDFLF